MRVGSRAYRENVRRYLAETLRCWADRLDVPRSIPPRPLTLPCEHCGFFRGTDSWLRAHLAGPDIADASSRTDPPYTRKHGSRGSRH